MSCYHIAVRSPENTGAFFVSSGKAANNRLSRIHWPWLFLILLVFFIPLGCGTTTAKKTTSTATVRFALKGLTVNGQTADFSKPIHFERGFDYSLVMDIANITKKSASKSGVLRIVKDDVIVQSTSFALLKPTNADLRVPIKFQIPGDMNGGKVALVLRDGDGIMVEISGVIH